MITYDQLCKASPLNRERISSISETYLSMIAEGCSQRNPAKQSHCCWSRLEHREFLYSEIGEGWGSGKYLEYGDSNGAGKGRWWGSSNGSHYFCFYKQNGNGSGTVKLNPLYHIE